MRLARNLTIGFITLWVVLFFAALTAFEVMVGGSSRDLLIGAWISAFTGVIAYHIGSSRGSDIKTGLLAAQQPPPQGEHHAPAAPPARTPPDPALPAGPA